MKIALGTAQFGMPYGISNSSGRVKQSEVLNIINSAWLAGIETLDTAINYGVCESILGRSNVKQWHIISKLPEVPPDCFDILMWVRDQTKKSIQRLGVDNLEGLLLHRPSQLFGPHGLKLLSALKEVQAEGLVKKIGISIYEPVELEAFSDLTPFQIVQAPLSLFDQRLVSSGWAKRLKEMNVEIHARSIFLQGLLLMPTAKRPSQFDLWNAEWARWDSWLQETNQNPLEACLNFALSIETVDKVIVGIESTAQLRQLLESIRNSNHTAFQPATDVRLLNPTKWSRL